MTILCVKGRTLSMPSRVLIRVLQCNQSDHHGQLISGVNLKRRMTLFTILYTRLTASHSDTVGELNSIFCIHLKTCLLVCLISLQKLGPYCQWAEAYSLMSCANHSFYARYVEQIYAYCLAISVLVPGFGKYCSQHHNICCRTNCCSTMMMINATQAINLQTLQS